MQFYKDKNIDLTPIQQKTVAIIGYGNQGKPQALNLRDSGIQTIIGFRESSLKKADAQAEGFGVMSIPDAVTMSDVVMMMLPDEVMAEVYETQIAPHLKPAAYLGFCHGMAIHVGWLHPADNTNVFLMAPKAQGRGVRNRYLSEQGVPGLVAVHQDVSGNTLNVALAYGKAIGCGKAGIIPTTFREETESNHFSEQAVLCGGLTQLIKTAFEVHLEAGYSPEVAYFGCLHEVKLLADLLQEGGITYMREHISPTARFGDVSRGNQVIDGHVKANMARVLKQVQSGAFAEGFRQDVAAGYPYVQSRLEQDYHHSIEETGRRLREQGIL